ncbi:hypothetical protein EV702DRAFT_714968 [Suillus placidus]|uniref:Uncharacterized protein n=1 Tax=Suillus placidus TaxID=48579 RepID=A0A9P6ZK97_9AGAM|nr:hypothetical protein EV702DRAFT_714968 [Suillus placidus]
MIVRLYAMYQRSRKILVFFIAVFPTLTIVCGLLSVSAIRNFSWDELVLSGTHQCVYEVQENNQLGLLLAGVWILRIVWEVIVLCLAVWIVVKHFHEMRWSSTGWSTGDCFTVLIKSHVLYFAAFAAVSCFSLGWLSPNIADLPSVGTQIYYGILQIAMFVQLFVLGPRLILSVRKYNAKIMANAELGTSMTSIAFQELVSVSTGTSSV